MGTATEQQKKNVMIAHLTLAALCCTASLAAPPLPGPGGGNGGCPNTTRISVKSNGVQANKNSGESAISADGRFVAFRSSASNLGPGDRNGAWDIYRHDTRTGNTVRISVDSNGVGASGHSYWPSISADGRFVVFSSEAYNLVAGDTNGTTDVFRRDTLTGVTTRISVSSGGGQGKFLSRGSSISGDGRLVAFSSGADSFAPGDTNVALDIFVRDTLVGTTTRISLDSSGGEANSSSSYPSMSKDGRYVAFRSYASNLVAGDTNGVYDIFLRDTLTGTTTRVSVSSSGVEGNQDSSVPTVSGAGRFVSFYSKATNLVAGDTNGYTDVFLHDTLTGTTTRVSVGPKGVEANGDSFGSSTSNDGRYVGFSSFGSNLVPRDTNKTNDTFVHDTLTGTTTRISVASDGSQGSSSGGLPSISADGRFASFDSLSSDLVPGDTNGTRDTFVRCVRPAAPCYMKYCTVTGGSAANVANLDATGCDLSGPVSVYLSNGPAGQFTTLLIGAGSSVINNPGGALGDLCIVGGFLSRYRLDLGAISASGTFSVDISNSISGGPGFGIPGTGSVIQVGETWNFQYWHRNPAGQPSGFSEAVSITFQ